MLSSCRKEIEVTTSTSEDYFTAETYSSDLHRNGVRCVTSTLPEKSWRTGQQQDYTLTGGCDTIFFSFNNPPDTFPLTITVDYGTTNCQGWDGKYRRGKVIVVLTGRYREQGTVINITPQDYYVNDHKIEGQKKITNMGLNSNGNIYFNIEENLKITRPDGKVITWQSKRTREWIAGSSTLAPWDDEYLISGTGEGVNKDGIHFTMNITKPIHIKLNCPWPVEGAIEIQPDGYKKRTLDFGSGTCDNEATLTIGNKAITIKI